MSLRKIAKQVGISTTKVHQLVWSNGQIFWTDPVPSVHNDWPI